MEKGDENEKKKSSKMKCLKVIQTIYHPTVDW
jgi:hypothetical protein